ncbi:MAG: hypothetical protein Q4F71_02030 [Paracoccus sp. (in: a-proteobacteria)]|nr:hypothetical protein [Paracoccus sp. (in: a-proteobacteria)]
MRHVTIAVLLALGPAASALADEAISTVKLDMAPDRAGQETATLTQNPDLSAAADLRITASDGSVLADVPEFATSGSFAGELPRLEVAPNGSSLQVYQQWTGIGRSAWESMTTLAYRDGRVVVAGETMSMWDRITNETLDCDWNLLTGAYELRACAFPVADEGQPGDCVDRSETGTLKANLTPAEWAGEDGAVFATFCKLR